MVIKGFRSYFPCWDSFLQIEEAFLLSTSTIGYTAQYYITFSKKMLDVFLDGGYAVEGFATDLFKKLSHVSSPSTMEEYLSVINEHYPSFATHKVMIPDYNMTLTPWKSWVEGHLPQWFNDFTTLQENPKEKQLGNYWNCIHSTAGLLVLTMHLYHVNFGNEPGPFPRAKAFYLRQRVA